MRYAKIESLHAEPFAEALVTNPRFRSWVLDQTEFAHYSETARLLNSEMQAQRSRGARNWWQSHYTEDCRCSGCRGQETDLLAIFAAGRSLRFAIHFEVKHPGDGFTKENQAASYPARAKCWIENPPKRVLPHELATTALLCSGARLAEYAPHLEHFESVITFEDVENCFPGMLPSRN